MATYILDHVPMMTTPGALEELIAGFRNLGFDVTPGGTHGDGSTYNALVGFSDGTYLELVAFVGPDPTPGHRWEHSKPGWLEWVHTGTESNLDEIINRRAAEDGSGASYDPGVEGGRETSDGKQLKWRIFFPELKHGIGRLPFFCQDLTPREWRVPGPGNHPCNALGIAYVKIVANNERDFATLSAQLTTVLGRPPSATTPGLVVWSLETNTPLSRLHTNLLLERNTSVDHSGVHEVGFWVSQGAGGPVENPYGKIVFVPAP